MTISNRLPDTVLIKESIPYRNGRECAMAPRGAYRIHPNHDCVGLCHCNGKTAFVLSFDFLAQHLLEGRIVAAG